MNSRPAALNRLDFRTTADTAYLGTGAAPAIVVSIATGSEPKGLTEPNLDLLTEALRMLRPGGLLFAYGPPDSLAHWGEFLLTNSELSAQLMFKYWIAVELNGATGSGLLHPAHRGLMLFVRRDPLRKSAPRFMLDTDLIRTPHQNCRACGKTLKDWGGKKHLMHPLGAAPSDIWRGLSLDQAEHDILPVAVQERLCKLTSGSPPLLHLVNSPGRFRQRVALSVSSQPAIGGASGSAFARLHQVEPDRVYVGDCISFLHRVEVLHPNGLFDLAFADPPYNLAKAYGQWDDSMSERGYLDWCNAWLGGMAATLKPGGSLFVLNLPKWAIHHTVFLQQKLNFQHWIAWDALSDPRGKLMPAHYALLWFTKPGGKPISNYFDPRAKPLPGFVPPPDAPRYCLRSDCIRRRKALGDDAKVPLTDVWYDIHRIKHRRDRDAHPCQLPDRLMERIIKLASNPGDLVFDPFSGAGTTAIAARKLGRRFVVTELDEDYVRITKEKLAAMEQHADLFGEYVVPRSSISRPKDEISKREIETYLQTLAQSLGRVPEEPDILADRPGILAEIDRLYPYRSAALKRSKLAFPRPNTR